MILIVIFDSKTEGVKEISIDFLYFLEKTDFFTLPLSGGLWRLHLHLLCQDHRKHGTERVRLLERLFLGHIRLW